MKNKQREFLDALAHFIVAGEHLNQVWCNDEVRLYPFADSFDDVMMKLREFKGSVAEAFEREPDEDVIEELAAELVKLGADAETEHTGGGIICCVVKFGVYRFYFGTANPTWGADTWRGDDFIENEGIHTSIPIGHDVAQAALAIKVIAEQVATRLTDAEVDAKVLAATTSLTEDEIVNKVADDVVIEPDQQLRIDELSACFISRTNGVIALSSALTECVKRALARELRLHALEIQRERFSDE